MIFHEKEKRLHTLSSMYFRWRNRSTGIFFVIQSQFSVSLTNVFLHPWVVLQRTFVSKILYQVFPLEKRFKWSSYLLVVLLFDSHFMASLSSCRFDHHWITHFWVSVPLIQSRRQSFNYSPSSFKGRSLLCRRFSRAVGNFLLLQIRSCCCVASLFLDCSCCTVAVELSLC